MADSFASVNSLSAFVDQTSAPGFNMAKNDHSSHPNFAHLAVLVSEAVLEVVFVSSLGYIAAKRGLFNQNSQKVMANLNIYFFTPCLIFSKLARQLSGEKLVELWIIPVILIVQTIVSWCAAQVMTYLFRIRKKPQKNFVVAMAVFGNSNSLPLSLVFSLSHTISGLHWDKIPGDNDNEVAARGILYLLIFSQLGQAVRWSWGMNKLLRKMNRYTPEERGELPLIGDEGSVRSYKDYSNLSTRPASTVGTSINQQEDLDIERRIAEEQILTDETATSSAVSEPSTDSDSHQRTLVKLPNGNVVIDSVIAQEQAAESDGLLNRESEAMGLKTWSKDPIGRTKDALARFFYASRSKLLVLRNRVVAPLRRIFQRLPQPFQNGLQKCWIGMKKIVLGIKAAINVPLAAIIVSVLVATIPTLKTFFYTPGSFVNNTFTSAINQLGGVAVPLILFVLGGNLCRSTQPKEDKSDAEAKVEKKRMVYCSLLSRMVIPLVFMGPILAALAKFAPVSILDDPIFIIVCFLLTGAPSALQLAQICQVNDVFLNVVAKLLVHSYVIWIFPSTLVLVLAALEVVEWAAPSTNLVRAALSS